MLSAPWLLFFLITKTALNTTSICYFVVVVVMFFVGGGFVCFCGGGYCLFVCSPLHHSKHSLSYLNLW